MASCEDHDPSSIGRQISISDVRYVYLSLDIYLRCQISISELQYDIRLCFVEVRRCVSGSSVYLNRFDSYGTPYELD